MNLIGIDPGKNNGFALIEDGKLMSVKTMKTWEVIDAVRYITSYRGITFVRIEDPFTWKPFGKSNPGKMQGSGQVKARFNVIIEYLEDNGIPFERVPIQGTLKKTTAEYFAKLTGWKDRTSEHGRDAAMLIFGYKKVKIKLDNVAK